MQFRVVGSVAACLTSIAATQIAAQTAPSFINPPGLHAPRGYTHDVIVPAGTRLVMISGQVALDSAGKLVGAGDMGAQATQVFANLKVALAAAGATFHEVVKLNYYLTNVDQVQALRDVRDQYVNTLAPPASTLVEVRRLARPEFLLEVEAIAAVPNR